METISAEYKKRDEVMLDVETSWDILHPAVRVIGYTVLYVSIALLLGYLMITNTGVHLSLHQRKTGYIMALFVIGIIHLFSAPSWLHFMNVRNSKSGFFYSIFLALLIGASSGVLFYLESFDKPMTAIAAACSFLLPTTILQSWNYFDSLSAQTYNIWYPPVTPLSKKIATIFLNSLQATVLLKVEESDTVESSFAITVPGSLQLGKIFHQFLMDKEEAGTAIQLADENEQRFGWKFWLKKAISTRVLDPEATVNENRIKQHDTILIERIKNI